MELADIIAGYKALYKRDVSSDAETKFCENMKKLILPRLKKGFSFMFIFMLIFFLVSSCKPRVHFMCLVLNRWYSYLGERQRGGRNTCARSVLASSASLSFECALNFPAILSLLEV